MPQFHPPADKLESPQDYQTYEHRAFKRASMGRGILIVDDEAAVAESLSAVFTHSGYRVRTALSAEEAIETLAAWEPDLAILDVMLPRMNGLELAVVLRDNHPRCRLVLFSGHADTPALAEAAAKKGSFFEILSKPVHPLFMLDYVASLFSEPTTGAA
ncbi:MAG TPA: response regulator [Acidobacteriaceae bacterium]|nr:response regulator [Acidobacteriaceae bacterium]